MSNDVAKEVEKPKAEKAPSVAELQAALLKANARLDEMEAGKNSAIDADRRTGLAARVNRKRKHELTLKDLSKTRAEMKEAALTEGPCKLFRVGLEGAYRLGKTYPPGATLRLPLEEDPSLTWEPITSKIEAKMAVVEDERLTMSGMQKGKGIRPADTQIG